MACMICSNKTNKQIPARVIGVGSLFGIHFTGEEVADYPALTRTDKNFIPAVFLALLKQGYFSSHVLCMNTVSLPMEINHVNGFIEAVGHALEHISGRVTISVRS